MNTKALYDLSEEDFVFSLSLVKVKQRSLPHWP